MQQRTVYYLVRATPEENQDGIFHSTLYNELDKASEAASSMRKLMGKGYHIHVEKHREMYEYNDWRPVAIGDIEGDWL